MKSFSKLCWDNWVFIWKRTKLKKFDHAYALALLYKSPQTVLISNVIPENARIHREDASWHWNGKSLLEHILKVQENTSTASNQTKEHLHSNETAE